MELSVHETAFMIAHYRAQNESLSQDPYAKLWPGSGVKKWIDDFSNKVSTHDEWLHCLRNRFFYNQLKAFSNTHKNVLFLNLGAGFSMYPYSLPEQVHSVEVDFDAVVNYKSQKTKSMVEAKLLPNRNVVHLSANITQPEGQKQIHLLLDEYKDWKKVILIEGVFFFLTKEEIKSVMQFCKSLLVPNDLLMCVSYQDTIKTTTVFHQLTHYFAEVLQSDHNPYTTLPHTFYQNIEGFQLLKQSSGIHFAQDLGILTPEITEEEILNEYFYVLKRI